jgi:competence protein ComEC
VFLNLWVGAVLAVETFAAAAAVAAGQISETLAGPFAAAAELFNSLLLAFPRAAPGTGWSSMRLPVYPGIGQSIYLLYFVPIVAAAIVIFRWDPFEKITRLASRTLIVSSICVFAAAAIILMHPHSAPTADGKLHVDFLDVGQGDSALVTFPDGETMLIDGGGRADFRNADEESDADSFEPDVPRIGEAVVSEFLWQKGYSRIDYLVATHADADHIQGLADVAANFDLGEVAGGRAADGVKDYDARVNVVRRKNIPFATVSAGEVLNAGGARIEILNPAAASGSANNDSVVVRIVFGERSFLMTGDIEGSGEAAIIQNNLASDVVKVPHHGSRTSSTWAFIDSTRAAYAVISVGKRSRFGHPHPEVVERWRSAGAEVIRTGESGTVTFVTDGKNLELYRNPGKVNE